MITGQKIKTFPIDKETETILKSLSKKIKKSDSAIIRDAIKFYFTGNHDWDKNKKSLKN